MKTKVLTKAKNKLEAINQATEVLKKAFPNEEFTFKAVGHGQFEVFGKQGESFGKITIEEQPNEK